MHQYLGGLLLYVALVWWLRARRQAYLSEAAQRALLARARAEQSPHSTQGLTGSSWRVHSLLTLHELAFESWISMSVRGLFLTYAIPSVSAVLRRTGGFSRDVQRRYADMELLIREFSEHAPDGTAAFDGQPRRAQQAIQRLNAIHQRYGKLILYKDMVYVWSVFCCTPALWMDTRWAWRPFTDQEKECCYWHWVDVGRAMNLHVREHFAGFADVAAFKAAYEARHVRPCEANTLVAHSTVEFFLGQSPAFARGLLRPLVFQAMSSLQADCSEREALGLPRPWWLLAVSVDVALTARALFTRFLLPPRPLSWTVRLTGSQGVVATIGGSCPMKKTFFYPTRPLDFNNQTYTPARQQPEPGATLDGAPGGAYAIEDMGPRHVPPGLLVEKPIYAEHPKEPREWLSTLDLF